MLNDDLLVNEKMKNVIISSYGSNDSIKCVILFAFCFVILLTY